MPQQECFAYIRVSTQKQGQHGVSLAEQRAAIERYAHQSGLSVVEWFEERETAAKRGRTVFTHMLRKLRDGRVRAVVIHKIDRGARNLRDWADLGELIDSGVAVHFATESLDLQSRGGRLSADIQAVVSADYIRNLREETRKGFYGRLNQGLYPLAAPIGYLDCGGGKPKQIDPMRAPLIRTAFELYATGEYSLEPLRKELVHRGLRTLSGRPLSINGVSRILNNPFYAGLIRLRTTGETFQGVHEPLISMSLFDDVQAVLTGKTAVRTTRHAFLFQKLLRCARCGNYLTGERQKGHVYYRCHTKSCATRSVREETVDAWIRAKLAPLQISECEADEIRAYACDAQQSAHAEIAEHIQALELQLERTKDRYNRLVDAYVDGALDKEAYETRKTALLTEQARIEGRLRDLRGSSDTLMQTLEEYIALATQPSLSYENAPPSEKRELLKKVSSNRYASEKHVAVELLSPFSALENDNASRGVTLVEALFELHPILSITKII